MHSFCYFFKVQQLSIDICLVETLKLHDVFDMEIYMFTASNYVCTMG